jgi:diguanylate cyclase (GGDEF)-like protein
MGTTDKPVVLLVGHEQGYSLLLREACEAEGNLVFNTPTLDDVMREIHADKNRRAVILLGMDPQVSSNAILSYARSAVTHRTIVMVIAEGVDEDPTHRVRKWAMRSNHRAYRVLDPRSLFLSGLAYDINNTPLWEDKKKVLTDSLTGLENLDGFVKNVSPELESMRDRRKHVDGREDRRRAHMDYVGVLVIDANRLKLINDTLGHLKGDEAIVAIASALKKHIRAAHHVCRKSGDEFLVCLPGYNLKQAHRRGKVLTSSIAAVEFKGKEGEPWALSAFFGAASIHVDKIGENAEATLRELIDKADQVLLKKKERRNKKEGKLPGER